MRQGTAEEVLHFEFIVCHSDDWSIDLREPDSIYQFHSVNYENRAEFE